ARGAAGRSRPGAADARRHGEAGRPGRLIDARDDGPRTIRDVVVRPERDDDHAVVRAVHEAAFPTRAEADLVDRLRDDGDAAVSLVAERRADARVVGHILFSPVTIVAATPAAALDLGATSDVAPGLGLAPL